MQFPVQARVRQSKSSKPALSETTLADTGIIRAAIQFVRDLGAPAEPPERIVPVRERVWVMEV